MKPSDIFLTILVLAIWGLNNSMAKLGVSQVPPFLFVTIRFLLTGLLFLPFARIKRADIKPLLIAGFFLNVTYMGTLFVAIKLLPVSTMVVLEQLKVLVAFVMAWAFAGEKITKQNLLGIFIALMGFLYIFGMPQLNIYGLAAVALCWIFWGITQLVFKKMPSFKPMTFMSYTSLAAVPFLFVISFLFEFDDWGQIKSVDGKFYMSLAYAVLALGFAMMLWQRIIAQNGINKVSHYVLLQILFGILGGMVIFHERLNQYIVVGALLIIAGVALVNFKLPKKKKPIIS
ncbi:MAG: DMT family transporter [Lactobacillales bacterium]|jgi:O-acetylserine/cysteine efflux transporter|nr:DMT family transporter [Lactobacillales bacterium]